MALKYNYQAYLEVDDTTYDGWLNKIQVIETSCINQVKKLANGYDSTKSYQQEFDYIKENLFITLFGDDLTANMFNFHKGLINQMEDEIKYHGLDEVTE